MQLTPWLHSLVVLALIISSCRQPALGDQDPAPAIEPKSTDQGPRLFGTRGPFVHTEWGTAMVDVDAIDPLQGPYDGNLVLKVLNPKPTDTIADINCSYKGHVRRLRPMLGPNGRVVGIDPNKNSLAKARKSGEPPGCTFQLSKREDVGLPAQSLDRAYMSQVWASIQSQPTSAEFLDSLFRALKPGGELIIVHYANNHTDAVEYRTDLDTAMQAAHFEPGRRWQLWDPNSNRGPSWLFEFRRPLVN